MQRSLWNYSSSVRWDACFNNTSQVFALGLFIKSNFFNLDYACRDLQVGYWLWFSFFFCVLGYSIQVLFAFMFSRFFFLFISFAYFYVCLVGFAFTFTRIYFIYLKDSPWFLVLFFYYLIISLSANCRLFIRYHDLALLHLSVWLHSGPNQWLIYLIWTLHVHWVTRWTDWVC